MHALRFYNIVEILCRLLGRPLSVGRCHVDMVDAKSLTESSSPLKVVNYRPRRVSHNVALFNVDCCRNGHQVIIIVADSVVILQLAAVAPSIFSNYHERVVIIIFYPHECIVKTLWHAEIFKCKSGGVRKYFFLTCIATRISLVSMLCRLTL
jgi:hypothetical protein